MKKIFIVLFFILLGSALIVINNSNKNVENSFNIVYENNKNLALPDLTEATEIIDGLYRLYDDNGITIDYNVYNGIYTMNGLATNNINVYLTDKITLGTLTATIINVSNRPNLQGSSGWTFGDTLTADGRLYFSSMYPPFIKSINKTTDTLVDIRFFIATNYGYNNYQFKLQLEKGLQSTSYVVPKLIPHYQDNLSMEEKQKIGLGAFGGITQIIKTINDIIKPVGDFINGLLSWF